MPIYAYRCEDCGHAQDFLQKMSDPLIAVCPNCGSTHFRKQLTAAGFQLKGGGWYVTDFRDSGKKPDTASTAVAAAPKTDGDSKGGESKGESKSESKSDSKSDSKSSDSASSSSTPAASSSASSASSSTPASPAPSSGKSA